MIITMVVVVVVIEADGEITIGTDAAHLLTTEGEEVDDRVHVLILHVVINQMLWTQEIAWRSRGNILFKCFIYFVSIFFFNFKRISQT
uniref:Putative secreted protein n=1 Tax=Xenopsylla cheopis TaxID=163159 RepID=A0A6M2E350_XENCH